MYVLLLPIEQTIPAADTGTGLWNTKVNRNHGRGKLKEQQKILIKINKKYIDNN